MAEEGRAPNAPSRRQLLWLVAGAAAAATAIFVLAVLPTEFRIDPTGFGRLTGLDRLAGPEEVEVAATTPSGDAAAFFADVPYRSDTVEIPLKRGGTIFADETEWKVRMKAGAVLLYSWSVPEVTVPDEFYFAFHGQSEPLPGEAKPQIKVTTFREDTANASSGALVAPYDGLWGWYLQNQTDHAVVVRMRVSGYYEIATEDEIAAAAAAVPRGPPPQ